VRGRELADRGEGAGPVLRKRTAQRQGGSEGIRTGDAVRVDRGEIGLGLSEREPERVDDERALALGVASTRRTRLAGR
jgi:hypothetical protein